MRDKIIIKKIDRERISYPLLYLADPSEEAVEFYLSRGDTYGAFHDDRLLGQYVLLATRPFTAEIVNIAVEEEFQGRGLARLMIQHAVATARASGLGKLEIGTAEIGVKQISLYQSCGFRPEWIDRDFFIKHYPRQPLDEQGVCRDMVRLGMDIRSDVNETE